MAYTRVNWENLPSTNTPVNATNLNKLNDVIDAKADASNVYTKTETDTKLNAKANINDVYTKTQLGDNLLPMTMIKGLIVGDSSTVTTDIETNKQYVFINSHIYNREIVIISIYQNNINTDRLTNTGSTDLSSFTLNGNKLTIKGAKRCRGRLYKLNYQQTV